MPRFSQDDLPLSLERRRFLRRTVPFLLGLGGTAAYGSEVEADKLQVKYQRISVTGWPAQTPLRVGLLADFHCDNVYAVARTRRAAEILLAQKPDIVFLVGDYISRRPHRWAGLAAAALASLIAAPGGVFCVLGNHDWGDGHWRDDGHEFVTAALQRVGFRVLRNDAASVRQAPGVWIVGLDDFCADKQDPLRALRDVPSGVCKILLVHEPDYADRAGPGFSLQLSGHSHGGQICLPGGRGLHYPTYGIHYPEGLRQGPHHPVYTTRGIGMTGPQMRLFCPPEVTLLELHAA